MALSRCCHSLITKKSEQGSCQALEALVIVCNLCKDFVTIGDTQPVNPFHSDACDAFLGYVSPLCMTTQIVPTETT